MSILSNTKKLQFLLGVVLFGAVILTVYKKSFLSIALCFSLVILILIFNLSSYLKNNEVEKLFILPSLVLGMIYSIVFPPFTLGDELTHFMTEYELANKMQGMSYENAVNDAFGVKGISYITMNIREADETFFEFPTAFEYSSLTEKGNKQKLFVKSDTYIKKDNVLIAKYFPVPGYGYSAVVIMVGKIINLSPFALVWLVRIMNLFAYTFLCFWAIKIIPIGKLMMYLICLMPLSLQQAASCAYDSLLFATVFLYVAYVMSLYFKEKKLSIWEILLLIVFSCLLAPAKGVFVVLTFLVLIIPKSKFENKKNYWFTIGGTIGLSLFSWLIFNLSTISTSDLLSSNNGIRMVEWAGGEGVYISSILQNPVHYIRIIINTILKSCFYFTQAMTHLRIQVDVLVEIGFLILFLFALVPCETDEYKLKKGVRCWLLMVFLAEYVLYSLLVLLSFGRADATMAELKGQYTAPFLPIMGFILRTDLVKRKWESGKYIILTALIFHCIIFFRIYTHV